MSSLEIFQYGNRPVRTLTIDGEPCFIAKDICEVLEIGNSSDALRSLDPDEKGVNSIDTLGQDGVDSIDPIFRDSLGRTQPLAYVTEAGMYSLVLRSRKPEAKSFKRWITHEVLPAIRKTGSYNTHPAPALSDDEQIFSTMQILQRRIEAEKAKRQELEAPAAAWEKLSSADGDLSVRDAAQILSRDHGVNIGQGLLFRWLRGNRWIDKNNRPYQTHVDRGLISLRVSSFSFTRTNGQEQLAAPQVRISAKGLEVLLAALRAGQEVIA